MAVESKDQDEMVRAIKQIIVNCVVDEIDVDKLPMFDLEYVFLKLRARSVGENIELNLRHMHGKNSDGEECQGSTKYNLDLMSIEVEKEEGHDRTIVLDEDSGIGIVLNYPSISLADAMNESAGKSQVEVITDLVVKSIDSIFDNNDVYPSSESSREEIANFINDLTQDQFEKVTNFFSTMPKLKTKIEWVCQSCGKEDSVELEGMASFFG